MFKKQINILRYEHYTIPLTNCKRVKKLYCTYINTILAKKWNKVKIS